MWPRKMGSESFQARRWASPRRMKAPLRVATRRAGEVFWGFACARFIWYFTPLGSFLAVNHPRHAELINELAKTGGPKCLLKRHLHRPIFRQCVKYAFRLRRILEAKSRREASRFLI